MKIPQSFPISKFRFPIAKKGGSQGHSVSIENRPFKARRRPEQGIALVITLIMLAVTLVMAVAFLALSRRERNSVSTATDTSAARLAADTALNRAEAQIAASIQAGFNGLASTNGFGFRMIVSTNYINPLGFTTGSGNPTNVNYDLYYSSTGPRLGPLSVADFEQNVSNLWYLPRVPVFVPTNQVIPGYDFRYYLDLNENGRFDTNGWAPMLSGNTTLPYYNTDGVPTNDPSVGTLYIPPTVARIFNIGDPEWVGILQHPDAPHGPNNQFVGRYAFMAVPIGNDLDLNYIHNQALNTANSAAGNILNTADGYSRNQGVGAWEINLAGFLADLNTNSWSPTFLPDNLYYAYNEPFGFNNAGRTFQDAFSILKYRYNGVSLPSAGASLFYAPQVFPYDGMDGYSDGPWQTNFDTNLDLYAPASDGDLSPRSKSWSGSDNPNRFYSINDILDGSKVGTGPNTFTNHLRNAGNLNDTYDRYTYYRMLDSIGTDSTIEQGKLNLNYSNAVVTYRPNGTVESVGIVDGADTNLVPWRPENFFNAAADQLLRLYSTEWFQSDPSNYLVTYFGWIPRGYVDATGVGVTNFPYFGVTNQIPSFGITNIPVVINGDFVYSPAVNRLLQLAANLYDATTNGNNNLPHVFRPLLEHDLQGNVFIAGYRPVIRVNGIADPQLRAPQLLSAYTNYGAAYEPFNDGSGSINFYGVPWIIGAKKGLPNFNQFYMVSAAQFTRKVEITRTSANVGAANFRTNQMYIVGISNNLGVEFWNSYNTAYPRPLRVYANDVVSMELTNGVYRWPVFTNFISTALVYPWQGAGWVQKYEKRVPNNTASFLPFNWAYIFQSPLTYDFDTSKFDPLGLWQTTTPPLPQLPQFGLSITNYLQAFILDGNNVIDYVQLRDPVSSGGLNQALADPDYSQPNNIYYQWSTNAYEGKNPPNTPYGVINQIFVSGHPQNAPTAGGRWSQAPTPMGISTPEAEATYFNGFFTPNFQYDGQTYVNHLLVQQAPYTPTRTVFTSFLLQANDPLVHYLSSDLNSQIGAWAIWSGKQKWQNGIWSRVDDLSTEPLPTPPVNPIGGRYQPWGVVGQLATLSGIDTNTWNLADRDPGVFGSDYWDFPTNDYPTVGWIGRVHRGTPWQTVYLKSTNILSFNQSLGGAYQNVGSNTWAAWTGDIQKGFFGKQYDGANTAPLEDRRLFDIFTTRFNDNATRGTLPVNQEHLAAWSALFGGMEVMSNINSGGRYTSVIINPAGTMDPALTYKEKPPLWQIVNGPFGINVTRGNTNLFPYLQFTHVGDVLETPALSEYSPFLNRTDPVALKYGIPDEAYEWLPQQMMGLVRMSEPRYVLYCYGQALRPAPNGRVLSGPYSLLVTNYQITAESAVRAVIRIDGANTANPKAVVESYNLLPPN